MIRSAHVDSFARDNLPPEAQWPDFVFSLPTAEVCLMGPEGAVNILFRKELSAAGNSEALRKKYLKEFADKYVNPYYSAALQHIDDIIDPADIRPSIIRALEISFTNSKFGLKRPSCLVSCSMASRCGR